MSFPIHEYLNHIGWPDPSQPIPLTIDTLTKIQRLHSTSIPFDNFDFHIAGTPMCVDSMIIWNKIKDGTRGTYCFQGNYLLLTALRSLGFSDALLIPVSSWRPRMNSFLSIPTHCSVIVPIENKWILLDAATVDCIDGHLTLSDPLEKPQTVTNGVRYKFSLKEDLPWEYPPEIIEQFLSVDPKFDNRDQITVWLIKEDVKRDDYFNPLEPIQKEWIPRFAFRLPKKTGITGYTLTDITHLPEIAQLPLSLPEKIAETITELTTIKDPKSHHYKQWVGIRYSRDGLQKYLVSGYRFIAVNRPYSSRNISWCGGISLSKNNDSEIPVKSDNETNGNDNRAVPEKSTEEVLVHLRNDIGIRLTEEEIKKLKIAHNYYMPNIDHVWPI